MPHCRLEHFGGLHAGDLDEFYCISTCTSKRLEGLSLWPGRRTAPPPKKKEMGNISGEIYFKVSFVTTPYTRGQNCEGWGKVFSTSVYLSERRENGVSMYGLEDDIQSHRPSQNYTD